MRKKKSDDWITDSLNTPIGKLYASMMEFCVKAHKQQIPEKRKPWISFIKDEFTNRLVANQEKSMNLYIVLGKWLPFIHTVDKIWVESNIDKLLPKDNPQVWQATMAGYLLNSRLNKNLYEYLTIEGHYQAGIENQIQQGLVIDQFVGHIYYAYFFGIDSLNGNGSNIELLIKSGNEEYIRALFAIIYKTHDMEEYMKKIIPLWKEINNLYISNYEWGISKELFGETVNFILGLKPEEITGEVLMLFNQALPFVNNNGRISMFPDKLNEFSKSMPLIAGKLLCDLTNAGVLFSYRNDEIESIISALYETGDKECKNISDTICLQYANNNQLFLKGIHRKYNQGTL